MQAGDIFLVRGTQSFSTILAATQKVFYKNAKSSHVLISLADGSFVHATSDGGVEIVFFEELFPEIKDDWRAIRLKNITEEQIEEIMKAAIYYYEQGYNYKYLMEGNDHSSFCSELAGKIYNKASVPILDNKKTNKIIPADFDREADSENKWYDITKEMKDFFVEAKKEIGMYRIGYISLVALIKKRQTVLEMNRNLYKSMKSLVDGGGMSQELYDKAVKAENNFLENKNISFWDENN